MKSFNWGTRTKLLFGFGIIILAIIINFLVSYQSIIINQRSQALMVRSFEITRLLTQVRSDENRIRALTLEMIITQNGKQLDTLQKDILSRADDVDAGIKEILKAFENSPHEFQQFMKVQNLMETYRENRKIQLLLIRSGKKEEAASFATNVQDPIYENIRRQILSLESELDAKTAGVVSRNNSLTRSELITTVTLGIGMIVLSIVLIFWMLRMLRKISTEIRNGVNILGTSAAEILTTVTEVSTGATETATAVSETTTTVEEIRQMSMLANQKAQSVLENAQRAADAAENGKESVLQTIEGMSMISVQMNLIAETVVKLSEQNRSIGEITSTVNDIADQSNLLAVNAAIEAAKAGEQGRGFTVVAQEIRSLADQSKQATAQVKVILNEIQKAVNQAVIATEQGSKSVDLGNKLAKQSGEIIEILAESVSEAAQSVIQMSASSQQQMLGMDQIVPAMENIKQASEQNVIGTKQTQTAAHNLNDLGQTLKKVIEKFNV